MQRLLDLAEPIRPISPDDPGAAAYERFESDPDLLLIPVVDLDGRPRGLLERTDFALKMASQFGRAVYAGRPVELLMAPDAVMVDGDAPVDEFVQGHLVERPAALLRGFIVTRQGCYAGVGTALSLLQAQNGRIRQAAADAQASLRAKSEFLAVMSHEIRTPLNGVLTLADVMERQLTQESLRPYVGAILTSGRTLLRLLNDVLDLSRAEGGALALQVAPFPLAGVLDDIEMLWRPRACELGLAFTTRLDADANLWVVGDSVRLKQIMNNLVGNALKFTRHGEVAVTLSARRDGEAMVVEGAVRDTGAGVAASQMDRLFTPFGQTDSGRQAGGGAGLGLSICRQLAENMGGRIWAESEEGRGSTFAFTLRMDPAAEAPAAGEPASADEDGAIGGHILVVDDNATNRLVAETLLGMAGCTYETAVDGAEAVAKAMARPFDLILMDIKMPVMDGLEATRRLRAAGARLPIIALTANADPFDAERYRREGMDGVVEKPIRPEALFGAIAAALGDEGRAVAAA
ncbi:MAG TPA: ATP-binding protein [Caulobacteraceae bacterium]|nr:ATP-binding protein [Caulobacteraceae bacterium]